MKAYLFWHFVKLFEKQFFIAISSKEQNVKAGSHCNFMIFQWEPDLTFFKWSKNLKSGHSKQAPVAKNAGKYPQNGPNSSFKAWKWVFIFYLFCVTTLDWLCGTLVCKKVLKWNKNFNAPYLIFAKCNESPFWRFVTDMRRGPWRMPLASFEAFTWPDRGEE